MRFSEFVKLVLCLLIVALPVSLLVNWSLGSDQPSNSRNASQPDCETTEVTMLDHEGAKKTTVLIVCGGEYFTKFFHDSVSHNSANKKTDSNDSEAVNQAISAADLVEQRSMASSTWIIMIATVFGLFVASCGLLLIYSTLRATQDTLEEANRAADATEKGQRAYMLWAENPQQPEVINNLAFFAPIIFQNTGQTPALNVKAATGFSITEVHRTSDFKVDVNIDQLQMQSHHVGTNKPFMVRTWVHDKEEFRQILVGEKCLIIGIIIEYEDIFGKKNDIREFAFRIAAQRVIGNSEGLNVSFMTTPVPAEIGLIHNGIPETRFVSIDQENDHGG